jgi:hypothetical protein
LAGKLEAVSAGEETIEVGQARFRTFQTSSVGHLRAQSVVTN